MTPGTHHVRIATGDQRGAGWRTYRAVRVVVVELHALARQLVELRGFQVLGPVTGQVGDAEIVDQDYEDVGFCGRHLRRLKECERGDK